MKLLLVDDELEFGDLLKESIGYENPDIDCVVCGSVDDAKAYLDTCCVDAVLTDINFNQKSTGFDLVKYVTSKYPEKPIAVMSAYGDHKTPVELLKMGAFDFISKPIIPANLKNLIDSLFVELKKPSSNDVFFKDLIGQSVEILDLKNKIEKVSRNQAPIFILGESGAGKEVVARIIHNMSNRSSGQFVAINCGAIPADLIESELFGYKKGSFTGATKDSLGLIRLADKGTLFLDEIGELPLNVQVKLLRVVQEKKVRPLGDDKEHPVDFRILSASHKNLQDLVLKNLFRQDLFYRLHVIDVVIPPLRERKGDIPLLAHHFCANICKRYNLKLKTLSPSVLDWLSQHEFKGNVRELQNRIEKIINLSDGDVIQIEDVNNIFNLNILTLPENHSIAPEEPSHDIDQVVSPKNNVYIPYGHLEGYLDGVERKIIETVLDECNGNQTDAAKKLGITFRSMRYRLKKFDID